MFDTGQFYKTLDGFFSSNDIEGAEKYLNDSLGFAASGGDAAGALIVLNEMMGFYRAAEKAQAAADSADQALKLAQAMHLPAGPDYATTVLNAATAYRCADRHMEALEMYSSVEKMYAQFLKEGDSLWASLYNNMAIALQSLGRYEEAGAELAMALDIVRKEGLRDETAASYVNLAANFFLAGDIKAAREPLSEALKIYEKGHETDSHYAGALTLLGQILEKEDDKLKASMAFEKALVITYGNYGATPAAKELLGAAARCALEAGDKDRSDELLKKWQPLVMI